MNKFNGILFLKKYGLKTVDLINYDDIVRDDFIIKNGLSLRLSSLKNNSIDVNLPSIHNCRDKNVIKKFYNRYSKKYKILIHETVMPSMIGSISKYKVNCSSIIVIEIFKNFEKRKQGIVQERIKFDIIGEKYLNFNGCNKKDYIILGNIVKQIPFDSFDLEFVKQDDYFIFTDFYSINL